MRLVLLALILTGCIGQGCPPASPKAAAVCKLEMLQGLKSKADCEREIEASCP